MHACRIVLFLLKERAGIRAQRRASAFRRRVDVDLQGIENLARLSYRAFEHRAHIEGLAAGAFKSSCLSE